MREKRFDRSRFSSIIFYAMIVWTIICFVGTWVIIINFNILLEGFAAVVVTFIFAASVWIIPLAVMIILSLYSSPSETSPPRVMFKDLLKKGMRKGLSGSE